MSSRWPRFCSQVLQCGSVSGTEITRLSARAGGLVAGSVAACRLRDGDHPAVGTLIVVLRGALQCGSVSGTEITGVPLPELRDEILAAMRLRLRDGGVFPMDETGWF